MSAALATAGILGPVFPLMTPDTSPPIQKVIIEIENVNCAEEIVHPNSSTSVPRYVDQAYREPSGKKNSLTYCSPSVPPPKNSSGMSSPLPHL